MNGPMKLGELLFCLVNFNDSINCLLVLIQSEVASVAKTTQY